MSTEPQPIKVFATLEQHGIHYELVANAPEPSIVVSSADPGGAIRWRCLLDAPLLAVEEGSLRMEESGLVATVDGVFTRTGKPGDGYVYRLSPDGALLGRDWNFKPGRILAALDHEGRRYEVADTKRTPAALLGCRGPGGVLEWQRRLSTSAIDLEEATVGIDAGQLVVEAFGYHSKGGEWCRHSFRLSLGGTVVREDPLKFL